MSEGQIYLLLVLAAAYAPLLVASGRGQPGAGVWKFLTFCCCTLALVLPFAGFGSMLYLGLGIVSWLFAWVFAGVARSSIRRAAVENATLRAIEEQTKLLRQQATQSAAPSFGIAGASEKVYRGYTYIVAENGEAKLKLSSGEWRNFPSIGNLKAYVDAVVGPVSAGKSARKDAFAIAVIVCVLASFLIFLAWGFISARQ
jgi:hypothetical protein